MAWSLDSNHLHSCLHLHNCAILYTCTPTKLAPLNFSHSRTDAEKVQCDDHFQFSLYDESALFCNIASLQSLHEVIIMSQLVRRQVKPLISSDQVRFYPQFPEIQLKEIIAVGVMNKFSHPLASLCSSATLQGEARLRVLSLYKAWRRHIPIMCKDFDLPRTVQCGSQVRDKKSRELG